mmetsp:Transcript_30870/g.65672  ORF Transcript_30870/g.65672 Transcript_30870/m.65672 type:complete len:574 (-) Transcript_30870:41-1762(-)
MPFNAMHSRVLVALLAASPTAAIRAQNERLQAMSPAVEEFMRLESRRDNCPHRLIRSTCSDSEYRGLALFFSGYSACSAQVLDVAADWTAACLDVFAPTHPGHDAPIMNCTNGDFCSSRFNYMNEKLGHDDELGFDLRELPTSSQRYMDFVTHASAAAKAEFDARVAETQPQHGETLELISAGISLGGSMASFATTSTSVRFTRQLLINPFFGMGQEGYDQHWYECMGLVNDGLASREDCTGQLVEDWLGHDSVSKSPALAWLLRETLGKGKSIAIQRPLFTTLTLLSDHKPANHSRTLAAAMGTFFGKQVTWGGNCGKIVENDRGGFCAFLQIHMMAAHSFGIHALIDAMQAPAGSAPTTLMLMTERDGVTRNGLAYAVAQHLAQPVRQSVLPRFMNAGLWKTQKSTQSPVEACMYMFEAGTDRSDGGAYWSSDNAMPHANIVAADNPGVTLWWQDKLFSNIKKFALGEADSVADPVFTGDRNECVYIPLDKDAAKAAPWLPNVVAPEVAPRSQNEIKPSIFWKSVVLNFDMWAKNVGCPYLKSSLAGFVDCDALPTPEPSSEEEVNQEDTD